jgi:phosphoserine phosphatase
MAQNNPNEKETLELLKEIAEINERISEQNKRAATATGQEKRDLEDRIASEKIRLGLTKERFDVVKDILDEEKKQAKLAEEKNKRQQETNDLQDDFATSFTKMGNQQKKFLTDSNSSSNSYANITAKIVELKQQEVEASDEDRVLLAARRTILEGIRSEQVDSAEAAAMARQEMFGISDAEQKRIEFQSSIIGLTGEEKELAEQAFASKENLLMQQERYNQLQQGGNEILGKMPAGVQSVIGGIKNMIMGIRAFGIQAAIATAGITLVIGAIIAGVDYMMGLEKASEEFRKETGLTNSMMADMEDKAVAVNQQFANYGVSLDDAYDTMAALREELGEVANYSSATVASLSLMKTNFGVSAKEAAKVQGIFESVGGLSEQTAASVQMQVANMSKLAGVAPKKVLKDIAENAEAASTFFKGDTVALTKNAVQAARMGSSLKDQVKLAEKLLDFETGIEEELVAATFVGGEFNLSRARALAMEGKLADAQAETLTQIQRSGDFRQKDYFTQQQLAKASNMTVEEINKQLNTQEKLSRLSTEEQQKAQAAIDAGLDITNLNDEQLMQEVEKAAAQKEMASVITDMENTFKGILATVGGSLLPIFQMLAPVLKMAFFPLKIAAKAIQFIIDGIMWLLKKIPGVSSLVDTVGDFAGQADAAVNNFSVSAMEGKGGLPSATDASASAGSINDGVVQDGKIVSTNPADTLIATQSPSELVSSVLSMAPIGMASNAVGGGSLSALAAPLAAVVNEIKALRADMASGKIAVYMDTAKVTSNVNTQVEKTTRNSYNIGQA